MIGNESRIKNTIKNVGIGSVLQVVTILLSFVSRTIFVKLLGNDYLSCDGLFTNILTMLSFSELGIGSAIIYSLYKPIADDDRQQIGKLMNLFSTAYRAIAIFIAVAGVCVIPFLQYIVTDVPNVQESISLLYCLFLANTVASYIFGYKRSYLMACQKNYIVLIIQQAMNVVRITVQIVLLLATHNYILYLITTIICTLASNIISTLFVNRRYPWLLDYQKEQLNKEERKPIFENIRAIVQYKLGSVILNGTDNVLISIFIQTAYVGLCSNYTMIISAVNTIIMQACNGMVASIGNYNVKASREDNYRVFNKLFFISFWVFGFCAIMLAVMLTPFVGEVWLGEQFALSKDVVLALSLSFFIAEINIIPSSYRTTMGYFKKARNWPLIAAGLNIVLSIVFARLIGLSGIFFATAVSKLITYNFIDPYLVFKNGFGMNASVYWRKFAGYFCLLVMNYLVSSFIVSLITINGISGFIVKLIACALVSNTFFFLCFFKTAQFEDVVKSFIGINKRGKKSFS